MTRYAVILTHSRPALLAECVAAVSPQADRVIVVDNASDPPVPADGWPANVEVVYEAEQPPNLARFWNHQIERIAVGQPDGTLWSVALLCDDVAVPDGWYTIVNDTMRLYGCAAASTHSLSPVGVPLVKQAPDSDLWNRMCGWAFVLAGEKGIRADESLRWHWCDTDLDFQARLNGGMVLVPGPIAVNTRPDDFTVSVPGLQHQAGLDGQTFTAKYGFRPW